MLNDFRNLEARYSLNSYPYADSEYSQQRLRALGIATDQLLVEAPETPVPKNPTPLPAKKASPPLRTRVGIPLLLIAGLALAIYYSWTT